jgi:5-methylthioadenosine/S-adenosylhomocysteine deaminase
MTERILIRGGHVISMDPEIGDQPATDILIEDDRIVAIGPDIGIGLEELAGANVIDARGKVVIPGFVDSHRHSWQTCIRGVASDATLEGYRSDILGVLGPRYRPEDVYAASLAGGLECLDSGVTTVVDWSHIDTTPGHADAAIRALSETGIRAHYAYGGADPAEVRRIRSTYFARDGELLTMALAARGPGRGPADEVQARWRLAGELGLPVTVHVTTGRGSAMIKQLNELGLLSDRNSYVHACHLSDDEWQMVADTGGSVSIAPQSELQMGYGWPPVMPALEHGVKPALSTGPVAAVAGDMFGQMRAAFAAGRAGVPGTMLTARDLLTMSTISGARLAGLDSVTGSLTPGKQADIVLIDATALNTSPLSDPVGCAALLADSSNVETVIVAGVVRKLAHRLLSDTTRALRLAQSSRDYLLRAADRRNI